MRRGFREVAVKNLTSIGPLLVIAVLCALPVLRASEAPAQSYSGDLMSRSTEAFYNIAITPWAQLTPDIQYIDGARNFSDPAVAVGFRFKLIF